MSPKIIQAEYDKLDRIANQFAKNAESVADMQSHVGQAAQALQHGGWVGESAMSFFAEMDDVVFPAVTRLADALTEARSVALQVKDTLQMAEEEASKPFQMVAAGFIGNLTDGVSSGHVEAFDEDDGGLLGWLGDKADAVGDFIVDHRDEIALGGALLAAGVATVLTGGLAAPIIAGAVAAGGITLAVNAASPEYPLMDGVIGNTISGGFIGWGVGSAEAAVSALRGISAASPWAASVGGAVSQWTGSAGAALPIARIMTFAPPALEFVSGGSMAVSSGGFDWLIPKRYESAIHTGSDYLGMGAAGLNLVGSVGGNYLIKRAFSNPLSYTPGSALTGAGNSTMFQGHHLYPQNQLGRLDFANSLLDDAVLLPSGCHPFLPNLHTKGAASVHGFIRQGLSDIGGRAVFDTMRPAQQLQFLQRVNSQFMASLFTQVTPRMGGAAVWLGRLGSR